MPEIRSFCDVAQTLMFGLTNFNCFYFCFQLACSIIAGFLHFFFLSSFSWMFVEGIHILFMLVQVFDSAKSRLRYYYSIGYGKYIIALEWTGAGEGWGTMHKLITLFIRVRAFFSG